VSGVDAKAAGVAGVQVPWAASAERQRLADASRAFLDAVVRTGADPQVLAEVAAVVEAATGRLARPTFERTLDIGPESYRREMSLVNGRSHPFAPQLDMQQTDAGYEGTVTLGPAYEGAPGLAHGGIVSLLFDHVMAWATTRVGQVGPSMTATMSLTYRRPTPLNVPLTIAAEVERVSGRKVHIAAKMTAGGEVTVEGSGLFVKLNEEHQRAKYRLSG
jgi:acyl-coenzyme A thioesterase PaaI-like protein